MNKTLLLSCLLAAVGMCSAPVLAQSKGDWTLGLGVHQVNPKSDNGALDGSALELGRLPVDVDSDVMVAQTVIVGTVPETYVNLGHLTAAEGWDQYGTETAD